MELDEFVFRINKEINEKLNDKSLLILVHSFMSQMEEETESGRIRHRFVLFFGFDVLSTLSYFESFYRFVVQIIKTLLQ
jgi:uncharacterized protein YfbU (UPF0304 family)